MIDNSVKISSGIVTLVAKIYITFSGIEKQLNNWGVARLLGRTVTVIAALNDVLPET